MLCRYLKRGVNEKGRVANDVETEQIVLEDMRDGFPVQISAVVQNRGSIPLFWSQETSRLNIKPDIIRMRKDAYFIMKYAIFSIFMIVSFYSLQEGFEV